MDRGKHGAGCPAAIEVVVLCTGLVMIESGNPLTEMGPFGPSLVRRRRVQLFALKTLVDVAFAPPSGKCGQIVSRERSHRTRGRGFEHRFAGVSNDVGVMTLCLDGDDGQ